MPNTQIIGRVELPDGTTPANAYVRFIMSGFDTDAPDSATIIPRPIDAVIDDSGNIDVELWPNQDGVRVTYYRATVWVRNAHASDDDYKLDVLEVPSTGGPYTLNELLAISSSAPANPSIQDELNEKADRLHTHVISDVSGLQDAFNDEEISRLSGDKALSTRIDALSSGIFYAGTFDPSSGVFPSGGVRGGTYRATTSGTVDGEVFDIGDRITAILDGASETVFANNWDHADTSAEFADLEEKFSNTLRYYGAVADGVTDDAAAVLAANASGHEYIDMEGLTYFADLDPRDLNAKYYNGNLYFENRDDKFSLMPNFAPIRDRELKRLGTKCKVIDWDGANILWLGTSIPHQGAGLDGYPELAAKSINATVNNKAWSGSHVTFNAIDDIAPDDIGEIKALSMTQSDVARGIEIHGAGSVFNDDYEAVTKASEMTIESRIVEPFKSTDFGVVVLDHNHNDRIDTWGEINPSAIPASAATLGASTAFTVSGNTDIVVDDFVFVRTSGVAGLDWCFGRVSSSSATQVEIDYDSTGLSGTATGIQIYKVDRSTVYGGWDAVIAAIYNSSLRHGSGDVEILLAGAPSEFTGNAYDPDIRSVSTAIRNVADKYGLSFFDVAESMKVTDVDHIDYFPDAVHPTTLETREVIARHWAEWMQGGRSQILNKSEFVKNSGAASTNGAPYVYDRFSDGASSSGVIYGDPIAALHEDFSGGLGGYTLVGTAPTVVAAPWGGGDALLTVTSDTQANSYIQRSFALTTSASCEFDFQFSPVLSDGTYARLISLAEFRGSGIGLNYAVQMVIGADETVRLRIAYFDSNTKLVTSALSSGAVSPNVKYNVKFEVVPDIGDGSGRALLYLDGAVISRTVMDNGSVPETNAIRVGQIGSNYGADMEIHTGNVTFGNVLRSMAGSVSFETAVSLIEDTSLSYTEVPNIVPVGGIIFAQGFRYEVLAPSATDEHLTTSGGIKLKVLPSETGYDPRSFGVVGLELPVNDSLFYDYDATLDKKYADGFQIIDPSIRLYDQSFGTGTGCLILRQTGNHFQVGNDKVLIDGSKQKYQLRGAFLFDYLFVTTESRTIYNVRESAFGWSGIGIGTSPQTGYGRIQWRSYDYVCTMLDRAVRDGINTIKVGVDPAMLNTSAQDNADGNEYPSDMYMLGSIIRAATDRGIVTVLRQGRKENGTSAQYGEFMAHLVTMYKDNPYVWYNPENEINGGITTDVPTWVSDIETYLSLMNAAGRIAPIVINTTKFSGHDGIDDCYAAMKASDAISSQNNLIVGVHLYQRASELDGFLGTSRQNDFEAATQKLCGQFCIFVEEFGINNNLTGGEDPDINYDGVAGSYSTLWDTGAQVEWSKEVLRLLLREIRDGRLAGVMGITYSAYIPGTARYPTNIIRKYGNDVDPNNGTLTTWGGIFTNFLTMDWQKKPNMQGNQFRHTGTDVRLFPYNGNSVLIGDTEHFVPESGVQLVSGGVTQDAIQYVYAHQDVTDGLIKLEASADAPVRDPATGNWIKSVATGVTGGTGSTFAAPTRALVGMVYKVASGFVDTAKQRLVRSWWNRSSTFASASLSVNDTKFAVIEDIDGLKVELILWGGEYTQIQAAAKYAVSGGLSNVTFRIQEGGTTIQPEIVTSSQAGENHFANTSVIIGAEVPRYFDVRANGGVGGNSVEFKSGGRLQCIIAGGGANV